MIRLLVCDMAGTTLHDGDAVNHAFQAALAAAGITADPARIDAVMGLPKRIAVKQLMDELKLAATDALIDQLHDDFVARMKHYYATEPSVREVTGAAATIAALREQGVKVALNTGFSRDIVDVILKRLNWSVPATVDAVVASNEVPNGRPHPDMIRLIMTQLGVASMSDVAKVGDTAADLNEGFNAGVRLNIGVLTGAASRDELAKYPHTHIVESILDVPKLLQTA